MKSSSSVPAPASPEGERQSLNAELWHACAGPLVSLPPIGCHVVYFPQGHSEQLSASTNKEVDGKIPNYPNIPPQLICQLESVALHADNETDEVYAQMTLQPLSGYEREQLLLPDQEMPSRQPSNLFCKALTASDTSTHGGFSIPRRAAEKVFPPLDFTQQPPAQQLVAKDLHGVEWKFRHIYRGQPKRHLLTTGWSVFVSAKRLTAGDSVLFIRNESGHLLLGIRRANRSQAVMPSSVLSSDSMHIGVLAAAAHAAGTNSKFTVFYNPRTSPSEFVVPLSKYAKSLYHTRISVGMRFRMLFETEESSVRRYMGTVTGIGDLDAVHWPNSHWRTIKVSWEECTTGERQKRVSLWEIEPLTTFLMYPPSSNWRFKRPWDEAFCSTSNYGASLETRENDIENVKTSPLLMKDEKGHQGLTTPPMGAHTWATMQQKHESGVLPLQSNLYDVMAAAALQEIRGTPSKQSLGFQQQPIHSQQLESQGTPSKQFLGFQQQLTQSQPLCSSQLQLNQDYLLLQQQFPQAPLQHSFLQQVPQSSPKMKQNFELPQSQQHRIHPQPPCNVNEHLQRLMACELQPQRTLQSPNIISTTNQIPSLHSHVSMIPVEMQPHVSALSVKMPPHVCTIPSLQSHVSTLPIQMQFSSTPETNPILSHSTACQKPSVLQAVISNFTSDDNSLPSNLFPSTINTLQQHPELIPGSGYPHESVSASWFSSVHSSNDSNSSVQSESMEEPQPTGGVCNFSTTDLPLASSLSNPSMLQNCFEELIDVTKLRGGTHSFCVADSSVVSAIPAPPFALTSFRDNSQEHDFMHPDSQIRPFSGVNIESPLVLSNCISNASNRICRSAELQNPFVNNMLQGQSAMGMEMLYPGSVIDGFMDNEVSLQQVQSFGQINPPTRTYTKVYKRGSVGRSLDVTRFRNYTELRHELARMFHLEGQIEDPNQSAWQLVFIDKENDILLLGDDPWAEFVNSVRCIKILSPAEVLQMAQERMDLLSSITTQWQSSSSSNPCSAVTSACSLDF